MASQRDKGNISTNSKLKPTSYDDNKSEKDGDKKKKKGKCNHCKKPSHYINKDHP